MHYSQGFSFSSPDNSEPRWHRASALRHQVPAQWRHWLFDRQSLTQKLVDHTRNRFQVRVLQESLSRPLLSEARLLGIDHRRLARVRHVHLCCDEQPLVFARTIIPPAALKGEFRQLGKLGNRSLGTALFTTPGIRRGALQISLVQPGGVWARRSTFHGQRSSVLVTEVFLESIQPDKVQN